MKTFLNAQWENIVMVNYLVDSKVLEPYLPYGVELDTYENKIFVSLVGFKFAKSSLFRIPIPLYGTFDEVNLRFYVKRKSGELVNRGVVFISEIVPYKIVSFLANKLYKEHYSFAKMNSKISTNGNEKTIEYNWQLAHGTYSIKVDCNSALNEIEEGSLEEFIYEHYYGYTNVTKEETWEYKVNHPRWQVNKVNACVVNGDFEKMYGPAFAFLNQVKPYSIYNALGSKVSIDWKINKLKKSS